MNKKFLKLLFQFILPVLVLAAVISFCPDLAAADEEDDFFILREADGDSLFTEEAAAGGEDTQETVPEKIPLSSLTLKKSSMGYTGEERKQNSGITVYAVVDGQKTELERWTDYTISYADNTDVGTATVTVTGKGSFTGSLSKTFKIVPGKTQVQSLSFETGRFILKWKTPPESADGIQIQYSTTSDFTGTVKSRMIKNRTTLSKTVTGLAAGKTYYVRIRSYKKVEGKNFYSGWGNVRSIKIKKNAITVKTGTAAKRTLVLDNAPASAGNIRFAVWSGRMGKDDLVWYSASKLSNGRWRAAFQVKNHRNDGKFYVDAYNGDQYLCGSSFTTDAAETATEYTALAESLKTAGETDQLILVGASGTSCTLTMLNKNTNGTWHQLLTTSGNVGQNGIGDVTEWNRKTPVGVYGFCEAFGIYSNPGTKLNYTKVDSTYYWVDDVNSAYYNRFVTTKTTPVSWSSAEHIIDYTGCYQYCLALDFNKECVPGAGSAIFLHAGSGSPTLGCIAVPLSQMKKIMQYVIPGCKIIIDTPENLKNC